MNGVKPDDRSATARREPAEQGRAARARGLIRATPLVGILAALTFCLLATTAPTSTTSPPGRVAGERAGSAALVGTDVRATSVGHTGQETDVESDVDVVILWDAKTGEEERAAVLAGVSAARPHTQIGDNVEVVTVDDEEAAALLAALDERPEVRGVERDRPIATPAVMTATPELIPAAVTGDAGPTLTPLLGDSVPVGDGTSIADLPPERTPKPPERQESDHSPALGPRLAFDRVVPDDRLFEHQWNLHNVGQDLPIGVWPPRFTTAGVDINVLPAWEITRGSPDVKVAVIDTVIDTSHRDLSGAVSRRHRVPGLTDASVGIHGTAVASVIAARADDGYGIAGVAPRVSIVDVAAFPTESSKKRASLTDVLHAFALAETSDARIVNTSWEYQEDSPLLRAAIADSEMVIVTAAGNVGEPNGNKDAATVFPGGYDLPNVITVTALSPDGTVPPFAKVSREVVDLAAPGHVIPVAIPLGDEGQEHIYQHGTSLAAPHVSGALALALSVAPYLDAHELADAVVRTSRYERTLASATSSGGRLDVAALVEGVQRPVCRPDRFALDRFSDVGRDSVHAAGIACLDELGVVSGYPDGTYRPTAPVTREQLSSLLARKLRAEGFPPASGPPDYDDVNPDSEHAWAIAMLDELGIVQGDLHGRFRPHDPVRRDHMAAVMVRTYQVLTGTSPTPSRSWFDDLAGNHHRDTIDLGRDLGVLRGVGGGDYAPALTTRRDQVATFMARLLDAVERDAASGSR